MARRAPTAGSSPTRARLKSVRYAPLSRVGAEAHDPFFSLADDFVRLKLAMFAWPRTVERRKQENPEHCIAAGFGVGHQRRRVNLSQVFIGEVVALGSSVLCSSDGQPSRGIVVDPFLVEGDLQHRADCGEVFPNRRRAQRRKPAARAAEICSRNGSSPTAFLGRDGN